MAKKLTEILKKKKAPENPKNDDTIIEDIGTVDEQLASIAEQRKSLVMKLQAKEITLAAYDDKELELRAKTLVIDPEGLGAKFDEKVANETFATRNRNAVRAYRHSMKLLGSFTDELSKAMTVELATGGTVPADIKPKAVTALDLVRIYNAVGNIASTDMAAEQTFTDPMVAYLENPLSFLNVIPKRTTTSMTIRDLQEDSAKVEGGYGAVAEGAGLPQIDFGTKEESRGLAVVGAYVVVRDEWLADTDRRHYLPYLNIRLVDKSRLFVEAQAVSGTGLNNQMTGVTIDGVISEIAADLAAGAWSRVHINSLATGMGTIWKDVKEPGQIVLIHPLDFVKALVTGSDQAGWFLGPPLGYTGGAPAGRSMPTLFGMMVIPSFAVAEGTFFVMNLKHMYLMINGGEFNRQEGLAGADILKREKHIVLFTRGNCFSRYPKAIYKITQA